MEPTIITMVSSCSNLWVITIQPNTFCDQLTIAYRFDPGSAMVAWPRKLAVPVKYITSQQPLVEVTQANRNISHVYLQNGHQEEGHVGCAHDLDHHAIGA